MKLSAKNYVKQNFKKKTVFKIKKTGSMLMFRFDKEPREKDPAFFLSIDYGRELNEKEIMIQYSNFKKLVEFIEK